MHKSAFSGLAIIGIVFFACYFIFANILCLFYVPSPSMEPTLHEGSVYIGIRIFKEVKKGDVIVFFHDGVTLTKRVTGVAADKVKGADGSTAVVPNGCLYVEGDNKPQSYDSRFWENPFVEIADVIAVVEGA